MKGRVEIEKLRLENPKGYEEPVMMRMPQILVDIEPGAILNGKIHVEDMIIHMDEFYVVRNAQGELNLDTLKPVQQEGAAPPPQKKEEAGAMPDLQIDRLHLKVGSVVFKDYSKGGEPVVRNFNVNLDEEFTNITDPDTLVRLLVAKALYQTSLGNLINFDVSALNASVGMALDASQAMAMEAAARARDELGSAAGAAAGTARDAASKLTENVSVEKAEEAAAAARDAAASAAGSVKDAAGNIVGLKDRVKLPFGKKEGE